VPLPDNQGEVGKGLSPTAAPTRLQDALERGFFAVTADLAPPRGADPSRFLAAISSLEGRVDALNLTENQGARVRACSLAACALVLRHSTLEPVLQIVCRGRNRLALQGELLGAALLGVRDLLVLRGDPPGVGDHPDALDLLDLDVPDLLRVVCRMEEEGRLLSGGLLESRPRFFPGAVVDPDPARAGEELGRMRAKVEAGARFFQTQPVFDLKAFAEWMQGAGECLGGARLLAGVLVTGNAGMVRRLAAELPGMGAAAAVAERLDRAKDPGKEGVRLAVEAVEGLRGMPGVSGVHLMGGGKTELVERTLEAIGRRKSDGAPGG